MDADLATMPTRVVASALVSKRFRKLSMFGNAPINVPDGWPIAFSGRAPLYFLYKLIGTYLG